MNRHNKKLLFLLSFISFFFFFIPVVKAIPHENDIDFTWINPLICDDINPRNYTISNTLNYVVYNDTDYFEHTIPFDETSYGQYYLNDTYYLDMDYPCAIVYVNNSFYVFSILVSEDVYVYNETFDLITYYSNPLPTITNNVQGITTDGNYIYLVGHLGTVSKLIKIDLELNIIEVMVSTLSYTFTDVAFIKNYLYITTYDTENLLKYDMNGNLIQIFPLKDLSLGPYLSYKVKYYQNCIHLYNYSDQHIYKYDMTNDFDYNNFVEKYTYFDAFPYLHGFYIRNDIIYYFVDDGVLNDVQLIDLSFEEKQYYPIVNYYPNTNGLFDSVDNLNINLTHTTNPIGHYDATFSFIDDYIGQIPNDWNNYSTVNSNAYVIDYLDNHKKIIELIDNSASSYYGLYHSFGNNESGSIEYWYRTNDTIELQYMLVSETSSTLVQFYIYNGEFAYEDGVGTHSIVSALNNVWYHIRIDFECGSSGYSGLSSDTFKVFINQIEYGNYDFINNGNYVNRINFRSSSPANNFESHFDAIGFNWLVNYDIGQNFEYGIDYNGFHNEWNFTNEINQVLLSIECMNGTYYINDVNTDFNVFFNYSEYVYDTWSINVSFSQITENGTLYIYNETNSLLYNESFNTSNFGNVKYIKHIQHYQNSSHFFNVSNLQIYSNDTFISGNNGFLSYRLNLIDTNIWSFNANSKINITGNGIYRFYVSNNSYENSSIVYQISGWIEFRNEEVGIDLSIYDYTFINPYLIVETMNGMYLLDYILITTSEGTVILSDERGYNYDGVLTSLNLNSSFSYFSIINNKLYFHINFDDNDLEYMELLFDINNVVSLNYQLLYTTFLNDSDDSLITQMNVVYTDATETKLDLSYLYDTEIEYLEQQKIVSQIKFYISDNDLMNNENQTIMGYIEAFTFNYSEELSISIFIDLFVDMLIPIMIILALTFAFSIVLKDKNDKKEVLNQKVFFPIFFISSILIFILGFFDVWILFIIIISGLAYIIGKRDEYK